MRRNFYEAFTLVEMLIVMGILIILMAVGITAGRFAINRANDVAHQNAVDQVYTGLQAYYTDAREFPFDDECGAVACTVESLLGTQAAPGPLYEYLDQGSFNGGTEATLFYFVEEDQQQSVLVCITLGGIDDSKERGLYCNGNGFNDGDLLAGAVTEKDIAYSDQAGIYATILASADGFVDWSGEAWE